MATAPLELLLKDAKEEPLEDVDQLGLPGRGRGGAASMEGQPMTHGHDSWVNSFLVPVLGTSGSAKGRPRVSHPSKSRDQVNLVPMQFFFK